MVFLWCSRWSYLRMFSCLCILSDATASFSFLAPMAMPQQSGEHKGPPMSMDAFGSTMWLRQIEAMAMLQRVASRARLGSICSEIYGGQTGDPSVRGEQLWIMTRTIAVRYPTITIIRRMRRCKAVAYRAEQARYHNLSLFDTTHMSLIGQNGGYLDTKAQRLCIHGQIVSVFYLSNGILGLGLRYPSVTHGYIDTGHV